MKKYKFIAVGTLKGGVGKTTVAVNLASMLAEEGKKVLLIDCDPQGNASCYLGLNEDEEGYKSLLDIYRNKDTDVRTVVKETEFKNLYIIGSNIYLTAIERSFAEKNFAEVKLKRYIDRNEDFFNQFDYIVADTNPSMSKLNQNAFVLADKIIAVTDVGVGALRGINLFKLLLDELATDADLDIKIDAIMVNKCKPNTIMCKEYLHHLQNDAFTKDLLLNNIITDSVKWSMQEVEGEPINYAKTSKAYEEFKVIVEELKAKGIV